MPLLRISAKACTPDHHDRPGRLGPALDAALAEAACGAGPIIVMVHGYKYSPRDPRHCPHASILSLAPDTARRHALSWPRHLGFGRNRRDVGLAIAFGWHARGPIWQASGAARIAGIALSRLVADLRARAPGRPVHLVAHSLGARVALSAIEAAPWQSVDTAILLAGAEYQSAAARALLSPGGAAVRVLNVTTAENVIFDRLAETFIAAPLPGDRLLGRGWLRLPHLVTLRLDDPATLARLARAGFRIAPPVRRVCHWAPYMRPGVFPLYAALLRGALPFEDLRRLLPQPDTRGLQPPPPLPILGNPA